MVDAEQRASIMCVLMKRRIETEKKRIAEDRRRLRDLRQRRSTALASVPVNEELVELLDDQIAKMKANMSDEQDLLDQDLRDFEENCPGF